MTTNIPSRPGIAGNRLVLTGAILYLLEWAAIIGGGLGVPVGGGATAAHVLDAYSGHADAFGWAAGWFSVVEMGRLLVMVGVAVALSNTPGATGLMRVAVVSMAVSCALEVAAYAVAASVAWTIGSTSSDVARALDATAYDLSLMVWGPFGVSMLVAGTAMWRSGHFGRILPLLAVVGGAMATLLGLAFTAPSAHGAVGALGAATLFFWVWMVWTGVVVWRAPRAVRHATPEPMTLSA